MNWNICSSRRPLPCFVMISTFFLLLSSSTKMLFAESAPQYQVTVLRDVWITMRDGVKLATDIYLPATNGQPVTTDLPTI